MQIINIPSFDTLDSLIENIEQTSLQQILSKRAIVKDIGYTDIQVSGKVRQFFIDGVIKLLKPHANTKADYKKRLNKLWRFNHWSLHHFVLEKVEDKFVINYVESEDLEVEIRNFRSWLRAQ